MKTPMHGKVYLVGAGPGDPDLLTLKAHALIRAAEVIFHDDLVSAPILALANPHAMVVNVGKRCGTKNITQSEINHLMISSARRGLSVVRLKSGDPGIFGRLAEERDALESASVPYEIVPGVTAALSAAASLGVSLTDRRTSSRIVVITAQRAHEPAAEHTNDRADGRTHENDPPTDWRNLAANNSTLVIYMPGRNITALQRELLDAGLNAETPAAIVSAASTPEQLEHLTTLGQLHNAPPMAAPSVLLIGRTLEHAERSASNSVPLTWESFLEAAEASIAETNSNQNLERSLIS
jgi:uroporphyrin-III C-methyltransferase